MSHKTNTNLKNEQTIIAFYNTARQEILTRIKLRDNTLLFFIGVSSTIFAIPLVFESKSNLLLAIPYLSLGISLIVAQHNDIIGSLAAYLNKEFTKVKKKVGVSHWDDSVCLHDFHKHAMLYRSFGHLTILLLPTGISLYQNKSMVSGTNGEKLMFWGSVLSAFIVISLSVSSYITRRRLIKSKRKVSQNE